MLRIFLISQNGSGNIGISRKSPWKNMRVGRVSCGLLSGMIPQLMTHAGSGVGSSGAVVADRKTTPDVWAAALRMYLRFLSSTGRCRAGLAAAIPFPPNWRLTQLPRYIAQADVERLINSSDDRTLIGARNRAIFLLLARLGLRGGDIVEMKLADVDWKHARLCVRGKSKQAVKLPLPQDVGDALLHYLTKFRPTTMSDHVFLRAHAPHRQFATSGAISRVVREALMRTGIDQPASKGAHLLRHSVATNLLRTGTSLEVIGALLRHRSADTTMIYAKTDVSMLQEIAQPWIGAGQ